MSAGNARQEKFEDVWNRTVDGMSPKHVRESFLDFIRAHRIVVVYDHRISHLEKSGRRLMAAIFDYAPYDKFGCPPAKAESVNALRVRAARYIDGSYDGELMARSAVSWRIGRESQLDYAESFAGVLPLEGLDRFNPGSAEEHGISNKTPISPFVQPDNPASGLLPMIEEDHKKAVGSGDHYTQAYNFRYYLTGDPDWAVPFSRPDNYDAHEFELVGRYVEHLIGTIPDEEKLMRRLSRIFPGWLNAGEYNYHRQSLITMAPLGISHLYAVGDYATKSRIWKRHQDYIRGLHYFLSTDERVPKRFQDATRKLGLDAYHHPDTNGWPHQLYIRVGRRLSGRYTVTQHDVYNATTVSDPVALAQYGVDTYPCRRIWLEENGQYYVANEGNMFVGGDKGPTNQPYPIPYRAITPQEHECENLIVPVAFSASHLGYASARMEPTFMMLGEAAGIAAAQSIREDVSVQRINYVRLRSELEKFGQRLG